MQSTAKKLPEYLVKVFSGNPYSGGTYIGTAFFISPQYLLTANHVINDCTDAIYLADIPNGGNLKIPAANIETLKTEHGQRDIAVIKAPREYDLHTPSLAIDTINDKDPIDLYGFDAADQPIKNRNSIISGYINSYHSWEMQGSIPKGYSGGPVIREGKLIGVITSRAEDPKDSKAYCIPIDEIMKFLPATLTAETKQYQHQAVSIELQRAKEAFVGRTEELQQLNQKTANDYSYDIFISFSALDESLAREIWNKLNNNNFNVFWSNASLREEAGESWFDIIQSSLENSRHMLLLCTNNSMDSVWVTREYKAFFSHCYKPRERRLIPVLSNTYNDSLPLFLRELQAIRYKSPGSLNKIIT